MYEKKADRINLIRIFTFLLFSIQYFRSINFQIINLTRPEGGRRIGHTSTQATFARSQNHKTIKIARYSIFSIPGSESSLMRMNGSFLFFNT